MSDLQPPKGTPGMMGSLHQGVSGVTRSPEYRAFYSVNFRFRITNTDANITFATLAEMGGGAIAMQDEATLTTTYTGLKILSEHLAAAVQTIEEELGPIPVPANVRPNDQTREQLRQLLKLVPMVT
jgi:hypothetical protein